MDIGQMYNQSAMLNDAFRTRANETTDSVEKQVFESLANYQKGITDRLKTMEQSPTTRNVQQPNVNPNGDSNGEPKTNSNPE